MYGFRRAKTNLSYMINNLFFAGKAKRLFYSYRFKRFRLQFIQLVVNAFLL